MTIKFFTYLKKTIDISRLYKPIKANMNFIISEVFPRALSMTSEEKQLWEEDPIQFVNQVYDMYYEFTSVRTEAGDFLFHISKERARDFLLPFLDVLTTSFNVSARPRGLTPGTTSRSWRTATS